MNIGVQNCTNAFQKDFDIGIKEMQAMFMAQADLERIFGIKYKNVRIISYFTLDIIYA